MPQQLECTLRQQWVLRRMRTRSYFRKRHIGGIESEYLHVFADMYVCVSMCATKRLAMGATTALLTQSILEQCART